MSERTLTFRSVVLGCAIELTTDNRSPSIELSESILAAIESLLATSVLEGVSPRVGVLRIRVKHSDFAQFPFASEWVEVDGLPAVNVRCAAFRVSGLDPEQQGGIKRSVAELVSHVLGRAFMVDGESTLERLFRDEQALVRALDFTGSFGAIANTLGSAPRFQIQDWAVDSQTRFNLRRSSEWDADRRAQALKDSKERVRPSILPGSGESITDELPDVSRVKHSEITFESLIRESLWNRARWRAIGWSVGGGMPPWMVLGFENGEAAAEILTQLVRDIGAKDLENRLRITIVKGISKRNPTHYRVVIGSNVDAGDVKKFGAVMFRVHTMTPNSTQNLDRFLAAYEKLGAYLVGIGEVNPRAPKMPEPMRHGYVLKKTLQVRDAWTIGVNDIDGAGVMPDDDVPIPQDRQNDAPVLELLKWKEEQSHRAQWPSLAKKTHSKARGQRKADGKAKRLKKNERRRGR